MSIYVAPLLRATPFRMRAVLGKCARIFRDRFFVFLAITLIFFMPGMVAFYALGGWPRPLEPGASPDLPRLLTAMLIGQPLYIIGLSTLIVLSMQRLDGETTNVRAALYQAFGRFFPVLGTLALLCMIVVTLAFIGGVAIGPVVALSRSSEEYSVMIGVAGGVAIVALLMIFICVFAVAVPACVTERLGAWDSMQRSRELTGGERWRVFGLLILLWLPYLLFDGGLDFASETSSIPPLGVLLARLAFALIWTPFSVTVHAVTFHELRATLEGEGVIGGHDGRIG